MTGRYAIAADPYSEQVRRYFANPVHAGAVPAEYPGAIHGEAAESESGARVVISAVIEGGRVALLRYRVFGCPHLIAAAEAFCESVEGKPASDLGGLDVQRLMADLEIPVEKTGRVFILEDAVRALHIAVTTDSEER